jgi:hypothetical protein
MAMTNHLLPDEKDFARMETDLFGRLERGHTRQVRRHRLVAAASIALLSVGGVAGVTQANNVVVNRAAYCYSAADTGSASVQSEFAPAAADLTGSGSTVPPLQACIRNDQVVAVFPNRDATSADQFCENLGMSAP